jgi:prevent-host-death family protein
VKRAGGESGPGVAVIVANIADFKNRISEMIAAVEKGEEIELRKRNVPVARILPVGKTRRNATQLGCGRKTGRILGDLVKPFMPEKDWEMLKVTGR